MALTATLGSLWFGEVIGYPPCTLCWYQRICMYPLTLIFAAALWTNDFHYLKYSLPLALLGLSIAVYHNLLYYDFITDSLTPCRQGVSCTTRQIEWLGFITIPLMSLTGFLMIVGMGFIERRRGVSPSG